MIEQMKWENVYQLWERGQYCFPEALDGPLFTESVFVKYERSDSFIYGYDWLEAEAARERKKLIEENPTEFLYFTKPTNKGTIQTAEMLIEAQSEEECAAIWIAATAKELSQYELGRDFYRYTEGLYLAARNFLQPRCFLWHHAMKRLVPGIMLPMSVLENIVCKEPEPVMGLIQMNTMLLKSSYSILKYFSRKDAEALVGK
ncbi:MAG: hypothetical protein LUE96_04350 [Lachnospiraceae bacterium]|nr:hypothetical protein [Lachnospiraceae bacterium]